MLIEMLPLLIFEHKKTTITYVTVVLKLIMIYILLLHFLKDINANT